MATPEELKAIVDALPDDRVLFQQIMEAIDWVAKTKGILLSAGDYDRIGYAVRLDDNTYHIQCVPPGCKG